MDSSKYIHIKYPFSFTAQDFPDNASFSLLLYFLGCEHNCYNCHNEPLQNPNTKEESVIYIHANTLMRYVDNKMTIEPQYSSIVLSGGDPLFKNNLYFTKKFCEEYGNKYDIAIYTGYDINYVIEKELKGFKFIKCGKYVEGLREEPYKNDYEMQLASRNQEWYDSNYKQISQSGLLKFY